VSASLPTYTNLQMKKLIAFCGRKYSGKSSAAVCLQNHIGPSCYVFSFADEIKTQVAKIFGPYDPKKKDVLRPVYQSVGESAKQLFGLHIWVDQVASKIKKLEDTQAVIVIDDLRFPFERDWVKSMGGEVWRIIRPGTDKSDDTHVSETEVDKVVADQTFTNNFLPEFEQQIRRSYERV
jgi:hypothetical protein